MQESPEVTVAFQNNVPTAAAIPSIRATKSSELITHEMLNTRTAMAAPAEYAYLIDKIAFFQNLFFQGTANIPYRDPKW
jgi:hypothetical protein